MSKSMTPERAIEILYKSVPDAISENYELPHLVGRIKELIEYRKWKKPVYDDETGAYYCPNCQKSQAYAVDDFGDYCELCGQAIDKSLDWSDEE